MCVHMCAAVVCRPGQPRGGPATTARARAHATAAHAGRPPCHPPALPTPQSAEDAAGQRAAGRVRPGADRAVPQPACAARGGGARGARRAGVCLCLHGAARGAGAAVARARAAVAARQPGGLRGGRRRRLLLHTRGERARYRVRGGGGAGGAGEGCAAAAVPLSAACCCCPHLPTHLPTCPSAGTRV